MAWVTFLLTGGETGLGTLPGMDRKHTDVTQKQKQARWSIKKLEGGFCKFNCFEKTVIAVVDWIGLASLICKGGIITGACTTRMTSRLIGIAHEIPLRER
jgi:hypothetical protein